METGTIFCSASSVSIISQKDAQKTLDEKNQDKDKDKDKETKNIIQQLKDN